MTRLIISVWAALFALLFCFPPIAFASGPRWATGAPYYFPEGRPIVWYTSSPQYFTDPGDLSSYVSHDAADAIVKAAASVWTIPTANFNLLYGGNLAEHVSLANVYPTGTGIVFPADIQSTSYLTRQIAVLYDSDGAITDLLLGAGASSSTSCRQNAVTESVDSISSSGKIQHAILILNGRCTGPAPEQQLQLQYQLMRAFGRVIGLSWSQTNDNVFTGTPTPTLQQALHWPVMHPIDILCGPYTYQCMPQPFTLRDDDISGLDLLYPVGNPAPSVPGKTDSLARANRIVGTVSFPNGQGMQGVNVVIHRLEPSWNLPETWEDTSGVSGMLFRRRTSTPLSTISSSPLTNMGGSASTLEGAYEIFRTPLKDWEPWQNLILSTQPINPLYIGPYSVGPYNSGIVTPSGSSMQQTRWVNGPYGQGRIDFPIADAAAGCQNSQDGTESAPAPVTATGWWSGNICSYGHTAWSSFSVRAARTLTLEVSALDENSGLSTTKMRPVIGVWNAADALGSKPTVAYTPDAFNASVSGLTTLSLQSTQDQQLRFAILDQRGDGRPDYNYQARVFYADTVSPSTVPAKGAPITISGMGFRNGNAVDINGVPATITGLTANTITVVAPSLHLSTAGTADITVRDLVTHATTTMTDALSYQAPVPELDLLSAPSGAVVAQVTASTPLILKAVAADGTSPLPGTAVALSSNSSQLRFEACGNTACSLTTDSAGIIRTSVTPLSSGAITFTAASSIGSVTSTFTAIPRVQTVTALGPQLYLAEDAVLTWSPQVSLSDNGASTTGVPVQWTRLSGPLSFNPTQSLASAQSVAQTTATAGPFTTRDHAYASACAWNSICADFAVNSVSIEQLQLVPVSGSTQSIPASATYSPVILRITDSESHPVAGASITIHQTLQPSQPSCPPQGRCPIAPIFQSSSSTLLSGLDGSVAIAPLATSGVFGTTHLAASTGTAGFIAVDLDQQP
ncbi:MAG TPA: IPT/TIG domain-containing protein [Edaphobacter sp.]|nr:IPT/TIG domain-containing protein [Edaphobacter sp.]